MGSRPDKHAPWFGTAPLLEEPLLDAHEITVHSFIGHPRLSSAVDGNPAGSSSRDRGIGRIARGDGALHCGHPDVCAPANHNAFKRCGNQTDDGKGRTVEGQRRAGLQWQ